MIYVTGDTHANIDIAKLNTTKFPQQKELTKNDFVIICRRCRRQTDYDFQEPQDRHRTF